MSRSQDHAQTITAVASGSSHTPGPWKLFYATNGQLLGIGQETGEGVTDGHGGLWGSGGEREANARLIAAAPTMADYIAKRAETDPEAASIMETIRGHA